MKKNSITVVGSPGVELMVVKYFSIFCVLKLRNYHRQMSGRQKVVRQHDGMLFRSGKEIPTRTSSWMNLEDVVLSA